MFKGWLSLESLTLSLLPISGFSSKMSISRSHRANSKTEFVAKDSSYLLSLIFYLFQICFTLKRRLKSQLRSAYRRYFINHMYRPRDQQKERTPKRYWDGFSLSPRYNISTLMTWYFLKYIYICTVHLLLRWVKWNQIKLKTFLRNYFLMEPLKKPKLSQVALFLHICYNQSMMRVKDIV